jgi:hypothetical protein
MFMIIRANNYGAAAYFMAWIVLGKFILLALFLAVMLEAFENKYQVGRACLRSGGFTMRAVGHLEHTCRTADATCM